MSLKGFLTHTIPTSIAEAMANNEILQIVVFSMFFGIGGASLGEKFNAPLVAALDVVSHIMLKVTGYVMYVAPLAILPPSPPSSPPVDWEFCSTMPRSSAAITAIVLTCTVLLAVGYVVLKKRYFVWSAC